jgi:hypothetical protein
MRTSEPSGRIVIDSRLASTDIAEGKTSFFIMITFRVTSELAPILKANKKANPGEFLNTLID